ncbi:hypothetical protein B0H14DRAFT_2603133 [Mycena olivaceomarginata]|nr:hypothetical protein B0H14DRAFT_2603133 [Mycena olivaceomarginata]
MWTSGSGAVGLERKRLKTQGKLHISLNPVSIQLQIDWQWSRVRVRADGLGLSPSVKTETGGEEHAQVEAGRHYRRCTREEGVGRDGRPEKKPRRDGTGREGRKGEVDAGRGPAGSEQTMAVLVGIADKEPCHWFRDLDLSREVPYMAENSVFKMQGKEVENGLFLQRLAAFAQYLVGLTRDVRVWGWNYGWISWVKGTPLMSWGSSMQLYLGGAKKPS